VGAKYRVRISGADGDPIEIFSRSPAIVIPPTPWRRLLDASRGAAITVAVAVKDDAGRWTRFDDVVNTVAAEDVDRYAVYRDMQIYNLVWKDMGIYQRDLSTYDLTAVLQSRNFTFGCCNCHSFRKGKSSDMLLHVRGGYDGKVKGGMLVVRDGVVEKVVNTKIPFMKVPARFLAWHPSGKAVAFSTDEIEQHFQMAGATRELVETDSDVLVYLFDGDVVTMSGDTARPDRVESMPAWSSDGETLYYVSGPQIRRKGYRTQYFDLMRVRCDLDKRTWEKPEIVISTDPGTPGLASPAMPLKPGHRSVTEPKVSPDGRWLLFCICNYGGFPPYQESSDLCILDLENMRYRYLEEANSEESESWHSWSTDSRWVLYSSKRPDGVLSRAYLTYIDVDGHAHKPIVLPQKDPAPAGTRQRAGAHIAAGTAAGALRPREAGPGQTGPVRIGAGLRRRDGYNDIPDVGT